MSNLPIPRFESVKEAHRHEDSVTLIVPDRMAGQRHRYSVVRVFWTGEAMCIGRELTLPLSRAVARRSASEDGTALP